MLPNEYDLRFVEQRSLDLRREANQYRLARANRIVPAPGRPLLDRLHALLWRLHIVRPVSSQAEAAA